MTIFHSIILGIIEGVTEFLPVSSTGHLVLASSVLGIAQNDFAKTFEIAIQLGAILAVVALYWRSFFNLELDKKLIIAFIPTGVIGLALYHTIKTYLLGNEFVVLLTLFAGGIAIIAFERIFGQREDYLEVRLPIGSRTSKNMSETITYRQALAVGVAQALAVIPGVSRSAATILGGIALGISRTAIVEFSFLLAVPTMIAATGLDLLKTGASFTSGEWLSLSVGFAVSFAVAMAAIRWFMGYIRRHSFTYFGWYRIILSLVFAAMFFA